MSLLIFPIHLTAYLAGFVGALVYAVLSLLFGAA